MRARRVLFAQGETVAASLGGFTEVSIDQAIRFAYRTLRDVAARVFVTQEGLQKINRTLIAGEKKFQKGQQMLAGFDADEMFDFAGVDLRLLRRNVQNIFHEFDENNAFRFDFLRQRIAVLGEMQKLILIFFDQPSLLQSFERD